MPSFKIWLYAKALAEGQSGIIYEIDDDPDRIIKLPKTTGMVDDFYLEALVIPPVSNLITKQTVIMIFILQK